MDTAACQALPLVVLGYMFTAEPACLTSCLMHCSFAVTEHFVILVHWPAVIKPMKLLVRFCQTVLRPPLRARYRKARMPASLFAGPPPHDAPLPCVATAACGTVAGVTAVLVSSCSWPSRSAQKMPSPRILMPAAGQAVLGVHREMRFLSTMCLGKGCTWSQPNPLAADGAAASGGFVVGAAAGLTLPGVRPPPRRRRAGRQLQVRQQESASGHVILRHVRFLLERYVDRICHVGRESHRGSEAMCECSSSAVAAAEVQHRLQKQARGRDIDTQTDRCRPDPMPIPDRSEAFYAFHHVNAFEDVGGNIAVDVAACDDLSIAKTFKLKHLRKGNRPFNRVFPKR